MRKKADNERHVEAVCMGLRKGERHDVKVLGSLTIEGNTEKRQTCLCSTINFSLCGALVETGSEIPDGALLKYRFYIPGMTDPVMIVGEVVRTAHKAQAHAGHGHLSRLNRYGIVFLDMTVEDRLAVRGYLARERRH